MSPRPCLKALPALRPSSSSQSSSDVPDYTYTVELLSPYTGALPFASSSRFLPLDSPHVHFPPTPTLTQIATTHSALSYDRKPIEVVANDLALPDRGERKVGAGIPEAALVPEEGYFHQRMFVHADDDPESSAPSSPPPFFVAANASSSRIGTSPSFTPHAHPYHSAFHRLRRNSADAQPHYMHPPPPLIFDHSSESDSDMCASPPDLDLSHTMPHISVHFASLSRALHSPSAMARKRDETFGVAKRPSARRRHCLIASSESDAHSDPEELCGDSYVGSSAGSGAAGGGSRCELGGVLNRTSSRIRKISSAECIASSSSGFGQPGLEGCLGGF